MSASQWTSSAPPGMPCPRCHVDLLMSERQGIEIDYCPKCRGVWLDRGELDKLIERSEQQAPAAAPPPQQSAWTQPSAPPPGSDHGRHGGHDDDYGKRGRRKSSWFSELFD